MIRFWMGVSCGLCIIASAEIGKSFPATIFAFCAGLLYATLMLTYEDDEDDDDDVR